LETLEKDVRKDMRIASLFPVATAALLLFGPGLSFAQTAAAPAPAPATSTPAPAQNVPASPNVTPNGDIISTLQGSGHFTILLKALSDAQLSPTVKSTPNLTLFAPTDDAFRILPAAQLAALMAPTNAPILQKILIYHLVHLDLDSSKIKGAKGPVQTVEQGKLQLDGSGPVLKVNNADIIQPDVRVSNGIIHVIDKVLIPSDVQLPTVAAARPAAPAGG
jgi:uncharacterized surface protein with fasciclin (FAS1) repeats